MGDINEIPAGNDGHKTGTRWIVFFSVLSAVLIYVIFRYGELMLGVPGGAPVHGRSGGAERGAILDRNGRILAIETIFGDIGVNPSKLKDIDAMSEALAPVLGMSEAAVKARAHAATEFTYIKKRVERAAARRIEEIITEKRLSGITVDFVRGRVYPEETLAAQIIGFTGDENRGLEGIEFAFDNDLRSQISPGGESLPGNRVVLTLDANVQYILEEIAARILGEHKAEAVLLTAMDPRSGDILGAASLPGYNPNKFGEADRARWSFKPATWSYEPGSVFKIFSMAGLLDGGHIGRRTTFYCNGYYEHTTNRGERVVIKCLGAHGNVTAQDIIIYSCNAGAGYAADVAGSEAFFEILRVLGFGAKTGSGIPGEAVGFLRAPARWSARSKPTISMGQEIAVSSLQMLKAATAVATDGTLRSPRFVSRIVTKDGELVREHVPAAPVKVLKTETARVMRSYMREVTSDRGTGRRAYIEDIPLAVKTGTAEMLDTETGSYSKTNYIASCMAMLPEDDPVLVIYLAIFKPHGESYLGGRIAAPYVRETAEQLVNYIGIPRGRNPQYAHTGTIMLPPEQMPVVGSFVPDFTGLSKRRLLSLLIRDDLRFKISGDGWVKNQTPLAGSPLTEDTVIQLELE